MVSKSFTFPHSRFIGFDHLWDEIERLSGGNDKPFPKHNVVKLSETNYAIELAVAGYGEEDLTVKLSEGIVHVFGNKSDEDVEYLHHGITNKEFHRSFRISEHVVVEGADYKNGLLVIHMKVVVPESKHPRTIPIGGKQLLTED